MNVQVTSLRVTCPLEPSGPATCGRFLSRSAPPQHEFQTTNKEETDNNGETTNPSCHPRRRRHPLLCFLPKKFGSTHSNGSSSCSSSNQRHWKMGTVSPSSSSSSFLPPKGQSSPHRRPLPKKVRFDERIVVMTAATVPRATTSNHYHEDAMDDMASSLSAASSSSSSSTASSLLHYTSHEIATMRQTYYNEWIAALRYTPTPEENAWQESLTTLYHSTFCQNNNNATPGNHSNMGISSSGRAWEHVYDGTESDDSDTDNDDNNDEEKDDAQDGGANTRWSSPESVWGVERAVSLEIVTDTDARRQYMYRMVRQYQSQPTTPTTTPLSPATKERFLAQCCQTASRPARLLAHHIATRGSEL